MQIAKTSAINMKIGILTFHWATNYGAVLQCYALQTYLESLGHEVKVINYKPARYDESLCKFLRYRKLLHISDYVRTRKMEKELKAFRDKYLNQTNRVRTFDSIERITSKFDMIVSGSDQVLNPFFLMEGEGTHKITPTYFLGFPFCGKRIGYALSFGCVSYPENALLEARKHIGYFDRISVRETSGIDIVKSMGRNDAIVVPDPTLLLDAKLYHNIADEFLCVRGTAYTYCFFIRHLKERKQALHPDLMDRTTLWNNDDGHYSLSAWLNKLKYADYVITDSFHCVVMCLKLHKPFSVITEQEGNVGMNDRLYTLLSGINLEYRIIHKDDLGIVQLFPLRGIDWRYVDDYLNDCMQKGRDFFNQI